MFERYTKSCTIFMARLTGNFEKAEGKDLYVFEGFSAGTFSSFLQHEPRGRDLFLFLFLIQVIYISRPAKPQKVL